MKQNAAEYLTVSELLELSIFYGTRHFPALVHTISASPPYSDSGTVQRVHILSTHSNIILPSTPLPYPSSVPTHIFSSSPHLVSACYVPRPSRLLTRGLTKQPSATTVFSDVTKKTSNNTRVFLSVYRASCTVYCPDRQMHNIMYRKHFDMLWCICIIFSEHYPCTLLKMIQMHRNMLECLRYMKYC